MFQLNFFGAEGTNRCQSLRRHKLTAVITVLALIMSGCSKNADSESFSDLVSDSAVDPVSAEMPDIVFTVRYVYNRYGNDFDESSEQGRYLLTFIDKNGNYYFSDYSEICFLSNEELIEALKSGDERITKLSITCDADELRENYNKLIAVSKKCELVYPEALPDVEADSATWYGLYYGEDGKLMNIPFHANERMTGIETNNDRANEVYEWYTGAAKE